MIWPVISILLPVGSRTVVCSGRAPSDADQVALHDLLLDGHVQVVEPREVSPYHLTGLVQSPSPQVAR